MHTTARGSRTLNTPFAPQNAGMRAA